MGNGIHKRLANSISGQQVTIRSHDLFIGLKAAQSKKPAD